MRRCVFCVLCLHFECYCVCFVFSIQFSFLILNFILHFVHFLVQYVNFMVAFTKCNFVLCIFITMFISFMFFNSKSNCNPEAWMIVGSNDVRAVFNMRQVRNLYFACGKTCREVKEAK